MKLYKVGGAVRDGLLGLPIKEVDWLVVGANPDEMIAKHFVPVGKDFPVFLHPDTKEEYALARTERKKGKGYHGFVFYSDKNLSVEDDLRRRDFTINAMALDENNNLIDPYGGKKDLESKVLRHTSPAFVEDPLRVLRCARFLARFHSCGFSVAPETRKLLQRMSKKDELNTLSPERVWVETAKALGEASPDKYFELLEECGALSYWFMEVADLFGIPQPARHHPEIDCGIHTLMVLRQTALLSSNSGSRFAALCHDLGKAQTPASILPSHHGHEERGVPLVRSLCDRLRVPKDIQSFTKLVCRYHTHLYLIKELRPTTILKVFDAFDLWRRPHRFAEFLLIGEADLRGRKGYEEEEYTQKHIWQRLAKELKDLDIKNIIKDIPPTERENAIRNARIKKITELKQSF